MPNQIKSFFLLSVFLFTNTIMADIGGKTVVKFYKENRLIKEKEILGSSVEGSFGEAFIDGLQVAQALGELVGSAISGNISGVVVAGANAYGEVRELIQSSADKKSDDRKVLFVNTQIYDRVELTFYVWSDDDPFGWVRSAIPNVPGFTKTPNQSFSDSQDIKRANATITIDLKQIQSSSKYLVMFATKETTCHQCLSIFHSIVIRIYGITVIPHYYHIKDPMLLKKATKLKNEWKNKLAILEERLNSKEKEKNLLIQNSTAVHNAIQNVQKAMDEYFIKNAERLRHISPNNREEVIDRDLEKIDRKYQGVCPEICYGADRNLCNQLPPIISSVNNINNEIKETDMYYAKLIKELEDADKKIKHPQDRD